MIGTLGNEEQKKKVLPGCFALNKYCCFGLTEPTHGSDASGLLTTAEEVEDGYILNGTKRWIGNAGYSDFIIIFARNKNDGNKV